MEKRQSRALVMTLLYNDECLYLEGYLYNLQSEFQYTIALPSGIIVNDIIQNSDQLLDLLCIFFRKNFTKKRQKIYRNIAMMVYYHQISLWSENNLMCSERYWKPWQKILKSLNFNLYLMDACPYIFFELFELFELFEVFECLDVLNGSEISCISILIFHKDRICLTIMQSTKILWVDELDELSNLQLYERSLRLIELNYNVKIQHQFYLLESESLGQALRLDLELVKNLTKLNAQLLRLCLARRFMSYLK